MSTSKSGETIKTTTNRNGAGIETTLSAIQKDQIKQQQHQQHQQGPSMPTEEKRYRCAVALNNMGVFLLERCAYRQALSTLHDALRVMRTAASRRRDRRRSSNGVSESDFLDRVLHEAERRVAKPDSSLSSYGADSFTHDDDDLPGLRSVVLYGPSGSMIFPVRINYGASTSSCVFPLQHQQQHNRCVGVDSAIMEYNLSLAHLCLSMTVYEKDEYKSERSARKALQHSLNAHETLAAEGIDNSEAFQHARMLVVGGVVLSQMAQVLHHMGCAEEMENMLAKLNCLSNAVMEMEQDETAAMCAGLSNKAAAPAT